MPPSSYERLPDREVGRNITASTSSRAGSPVSQVRPPTYYGEGPFDPPSSDDDDDDENGSLLEKKHGPSSPGLAELGDGFPSGSGHGNNDDKKRPASLRFLVIMLVSLVGLAAIIGLIAAQTYIESPQHRPGSRRFGMDHIFNGTFAANAKGIHWVPEAGDGVFSVFEDNVIKLVDLKTNTSKILVDRTDIKDENGQQLWWSDWQISPDMKYILVKADYRKQWRWSSFGNYYVHNIAEKNTFPVTTPTKPSETAYATWSPTGNSIAYVINNDLYVLTDLSSPTSPIRITSSGNASLFHGVPDWVYEEEIFSGPSALWWSPDSSKLAFLAFDETSVDEFNFPIYNPTEDSDTVVPYTTDVTMKYPKPGYNNPLVSVHVFDLKRHQENSGSSSSGNDATYELYWNDRHPVDNSVIMEVAWVANSSLLLKEVNRNADDGNVVLFDLDHESTQLRSRGTVVRKSYPLDCIAMRF